MAWNINFIFPFSWECHHPNRRTHIFQRGRYTTNQINIIINYESSLTIINHKKGMIGFRWLSDSLNHHENPVAVKPPGAQRRRASSGGFWRFSPCSWGTQGGLGFPWDSSGKIWKICSWSEKELFFYCVFSIFSKLDVHTVTCIHDMFLLTCLYKTRKLYTKNIQKHRML